MLKDIAFCFSVHSPKDIPVPELPEICISGRSNVGKSSLINRIGNRKNLAKTSQNPGKTRSLNYYRVGDRYFLVDLPGYGYAKVSKAEKTLFAGLVNPYLASRKDLDGIIQLVDARHGPVSGDLIMLEWIRNWGGNVLYVFTKADKLSSSERALLKKTYEKEYGVENIAMFSALTGMGLDRVVSWIEKTAGQGAGV